MIQAHHNRNTRDAILEELGEQMKEIGALAGTMDLMIKMNYAPAEHLTGDDIAGLIDLYAARLNNIYSSLSDISISIENIETPPPRNHTI